MSSLAFPVEPGAERVHCTDDELVVTLTDGRTLSVPLIWFPRLADASVQQRAQYELLGDGSGIHWPSVDEDISVLGLVTGNPSVEAESTTPNKPLRPTARKTRSG
jgi:hypothetical protein